jgi:AmmeMemoRadiSam system protein A
MSLQYQRVGPEQACGCHPLGGLLQVARRKGLDIRLLDLRNSGDTAGDRNRVVGYGAFSLHQTDTLAPDLQQQLLDIAHASVEHGLANASPLLPDLKRFPARLQKPAALFVTLTLDGRLRGCIGHTDAVLPLATAAARHAHGAAFHDPRFPRLQHQEFARMTLSISVLGEKTRLYFDTEESLRRQLQPGVHGLVIARGEKSATFLPSVWENLTRPAEFLAQLKTKAGISADEAPESAWTYLTTSFGREK